MTSERTPLLSSSKWRTVKIYVGEEAVSCPELPETARRQSCLAGLRTLSQISFPFLLAGLGMVAAGKVLAVVQHWTVFLQIAELFILVPALLGLKGNLEMTLASRLSTAANLGRMDSRADCLSLVGSNLALIQCQAILIGFLASLTGLGLGYFKNGILNLNHGLLMCASSVVTASLASFALAVVMVVVIVAARRCRCNPDNIATPIAASLGDVVTLGLLAWISNILYFDYTDGGYKAQVIIGGYFLILPIFIALAYNNEHVSEVLRVGWTPVLMAMLIASGGGFVLEMAVEHFKGVTLFAPVMNGSGGDLVGIQASRMTTYLNKMTNSLLGTFPDNDHKICRDPCTVLCGDLGCCRRCSGGLPHPHVMPARVLLCLLFPGHVLFVFIIFTVKILATPSPLFLFFYLLAATLQVAILLYLAQLLVYWMWKRGTDPDNAAIPYLTAVSNTLIAYFNHGLFGLSVE